MTFIQKEKSRNAGKDKVRTPNRQLKKLYFPLCYCDILSTLTRGHCVSVYMIPHFFDFYCIKETY